MITAWKDYLVPHTTAYGSCQKQCRSAFVRQSECIRRIVEMRRPGMVVCLGAGILNDIPYWSLVEGGATVHLVDWLPGIVEYGLAHSIIRAGPDDAPECVYCRSRASDARLFCEGYKEARRAAPSVCDAFAPDPKDAGTCRSFCKGRFPHVLRQDITGGYAEAFGMALAAELRDVGSWRQAFKRATALAHRLERHRTKLDIADHSADLVTSSMVLSQFEYEPYAYFSKQAAAVLGTPSAAEEKRLHAAMETLRSTLLINQIKGHCAEIERILAPGGRCFMAFELFHREAGDRRWYLVKEMLAALGELGDRFDFDFDDIPEPVVDTGFETGGGRSAIYHLLLTRKRDR